MLKPGTNSRSKCCNDVMEELLTMRQSFEKLFHRLTKEIVHLRRDITDALEKPSTIKVSTRAHSKRISPSLSKSKIDEGSESEDEPLPAIDINFNDSDNSVESKKLEKSSTAESKMIRSNTEVVEFVEERNVSAVSRPVLDFFNIQARVIPTQPFNDAEQFEDWNVLLKNDEDQRDQLRVELLQGSFKEPDKYIKHIWRSIFDNDAAHHYSYRGNGRCDKRAIKNYIFTDIFKEIFLQRFHHMDTEFFMERTMRFFKYARDQRRKAVIKQRTLREKDVELQHDALQDSMDNDLTMDGE